MGYQDDLTSDNVGRGGALTKHVRAHNWMEPVVEDIIAAGGVGALGGGGGGGSIGGVNVMAQAGIVGDGVANDTAEIQAAINAASTGQLGFVYGWRRHVIDPGFLTVPENVVLWMPGINRYGFSGANRHGTLIASDTGTGYMLTLTGQNAGVYGLNLVGPGSVNRDVSGIKVNTGVLRPLIEKVGVYAMPMNGIWVDGVSGGNEFGARIRDVDVFAGRRPLANLGASERVAGLYINSSDNSISGNNEIQCGDAATLDSSLRRIGVWFGPEGSYSTVAGQLIGELSDIGIAVEGNGNRFVGARADQNFGHGWWIGRVTTGNAQLNSLAGCLGLGNSKGATNTYDNFHLINNGGVSNANVLDACVSGAMPGAPGYAHRYGFYDGGSTPSSTIHGNVIGPTCVDSGAATRGFEGADIARMQRTSGRTAQLTLTGGGTPDVNNATFLLLNDAAASNTQYTNFLNGRIGDDLFVWSSVATAVVLVHSTSLRMKAGANKTLAAWEMVHLKRSSSAWHEV